jgi:hypothetical protein
MVGWTENRVWIQTEWVVCAVGPGGCCTAAVGSKVARPSCMWSYGCCPPCKGSRGAWKGSAPHACHPGLKLVATMRAGVPRGVAHQSRPALLTRGASPQCLVGRVVCAAAAQATRAHSQQLRQCVCHGSNKEGGPNSRPPQ